MRGDILADRIKVNTSRMKTDADSIKENVNTISKLYSDLVTKRNQLDDMWDGPASETFKKAFSDDLAALMVMVGNLQKICNYENMAKDCYQSCENQVAGVISDI